MNNNNFLAGFIIGGLIGAAIALVFMPSKAARLEGRNHVAIDGTTQAVTSHYEAPRIVLDEGINASGSTDSENV